MASGQIFQLEQDEELRIEVDFQKSESISVELRSGMAEIFGTEMVLSTEYKFQPGSKFAIFTYHGCQIMIRGKLDVQPYTSKETPMVMYLNAHAALEQHRKQADKSGERGPITMIVGPAEVGKSTLARILLNYAVRMERRPIFVDLDVAQGTIGLPGSLGALLVERPVSIEEGYSQNAPLVYHYGHKTPGHNPPLYNKLVDRLAEVVRERLKANRKAETSGVVINTCGWVRGEGYTTLKTTATAFEVDVIIVLDEERVYNNLVRDMPQFVKVVWLPKSGGVVKRSPEEDQKMEARDPAIKQYFYGPTGNLFPHSFEVPFSDLKDKIYKIGAPSLPDSCMPLGMKSEDNQTKLVSVPIVARELLNHVLAVSFASTTDELLMSNVAGFVCVTKVSAEEQKLTLLSPQPKPLPDTCLLLSDVRFVDST